ncbi:polysaccharide export protein [Halomonas daqiaonensis]|uniref:Polysaccharide export outer membrane protein n=1 Tax=Halomonas daqiaonensis TaxID=650850 RepID=A0A1H7GTA5_9GAMM|nr:polysaccharide export protein [Halomonas daqiaonensis]SEK40262.1 polysaccharide export outer membrane protein [Halomonas daqiaonensis]
MRRSSFINLLLALSGAILLSGCAYSPGSHFQSRTESAPVDDLVDIEPITLGLINAQRPALDADRLSEVSKEQRAQIEAYDYRIGKGDVLSIIVYDHPELTIPTGSERSAAEAGNTVHQDGTIFYPFIGDVDVVGRTVTEVRDEIARRLDPFIAEPQVEVKIAAFNSQEVKVTGEVSEPGRLPITNVPMTVLDAISLAGGLAPGANWHDVILLRDGNRRSLSLYDMLNEGDLSEDLLLGDGDVLHVPDLGSQQVFVMGEVGEPQALPMGRSRISLTEALSRAGSFDEAQADASGIFVFRRHAGRSDKLATVYQLDARNAAAMVLGTEFLLEPTDVVYVTTTSLGRWNRVINQLLPTVTAVYQVTRTTRDVNDLRDDI